MSTQKADFAHLKLKLTKNYLVKLRFYLHNFHLMIPDTAVVQNFQSIYTY